MSEDIIIHKETISYLGRIYVLAKPILPAVLGICVTKSTCDNGLNIQKPPANARGITCDRMLIL
jgi:hypothetical protein